MTKLETKNLKEALDTLKEGYDLYLNNSDEKFKKALQDSCIKRFEYTYETAKKLMNKYLKYAYDITDLPVNDVYREIYGLGLIKTFENWNNYRIHRNYTSHEYNLVKAREIINIVDDFIKDTEFFLEHLNKVLK